jgi:phosphoribosylformylglycinamidine synthase
MALEAEWHTKTTQKCNLPDKKDYTSDLHQLLSSYNICSKETVVRQYDHEVQGGSIIKPFVGIENDGPGDAGVICPIETIDSYEGIVIGHGLCPRYSDEDAYKMCANAIDEAIRNCVAVGGDPHRIAILDNFCWPDPVHHEINNPDGKEKLAQLVRANIALYVYSKAFMTPIISGKDSMKNDYMIGNIKISVPPTLLISAIGKVDDVRKCITMDVKQADDLIYVVGFTKNEMGKSEYAAINNLHGGSVPEVDAIQARQIYADLHNAIKKGLVASCHDCSEGGLAVALAESSFAGGLGIDASLEKAPIKGSLSNCELLFSESASRFVITVNPEYASDFEECFQKDVVSCIGKVRKDTKFKISGFEDKMLVDCDIFSLKNAWQTPLKVKL